MDFNRQAFLRTMILAMAVLSIIDIVAGVFFGLFFPIGYFSGKSIARIVSDLTFVEGAFIFFVGALMAFFRSNLSSSVIALLVLGAVMVGLSVVSGVLS